jgi:hypothetical protein
MPRVKKRKRKDKPLSRETIERLLKEAEPGSRELAKTLKRVFRHPYRPIPLD